MKIKLELFGASRDFSNNDYLEFNIKENKNNFNNENVKLSSKLRK
jgi:hypothetical protein